MRGAFSIGLVAALAVAWSGGAGTARADDGANHQKDQPPPILLGTTGGNIDDISKVFCCSGTLGALVTDGADDFVLSNNHVLARTNEGRIGDPIIHPGLIDQNPVCTQDAGDTVATLADFVAISFDKGTENTVDAAVAAAFTGAVSNDILDIGPPSSLVQAAGVGLPVKKSGRTTGLTAGVVTAVAVTADIAYSKKCGQGRQVARFVDQILIEPGGFSAGGDSGALIVEDASGGNRPVGLLFAGSDTVTLANPIGRVLECLGVAFIGGTVPARVDCEVVADGGNGGGGGKGKGPGGGGPPGQQSVPPGLETASAVKARHDAQLLAIPGVVGTGVSTDADGNPVIEVYVEAAARARGQAIPANLEGIPVRVVVTGPFKAR